jgi:hypothetical protein
MGLTRASKAEIGVTINEGAARLDARLGPRIKSGEGITGGGGTAGLRFFWASPE